MNTWNLVASAASVMSLIFHLSGKGAYIRQFTLPATMALVGFTIGRHESKIDDTSNLIQQDPHLLFMLVLILLLFGLTMYLVESTKPDAKVSFIFLIFLAMVAVPQLIKTYDGIAPMVSTQDYLVLARIKEASGNTDEAIRYLKIYSKRIDRPEIKKQVGERIESLRKQQFKRDSTKNKFPEVW
jgi:phosphoglycerol transferase MdoB-like AlkP superfamily enzyme